MLHCVKFNSPGCRSFQKAESLPILKIFLGAIAVDSTLLYESEAEEQQHLSVVSMLAKELGLAEASVRQIYEDELQVLQKHARIKTFLSIFVSRNVKKKIVEHGISPAGRGEEEGKRALNLLA